MRRSRQSVRTGFGWTEEVPPPEGEAIGWSGVGLRFLLRAGLLYATIRLLWAPVRGRFIDLLAGAVETSLYLLDRATLVSSVTSYDNVFVIHSPLAGSPQTFATWNGSLLHLLVAIPVALVLALPLGDRRLRADLIPATVAVVLFVVMAFTMVQVENVIAERAATDFGLYLHGSGARLLLPLLAPTLMALDILILPAALLLISYRSLRLIASRETGRSSPTGEQLSSVRPRLPRNLAWGAVALIGGGLGVLVLWPVGSGAAATEPPFADWEEIQNLNMESAPALVNSAVQRERQGHVDEAIRLYRNALEIDPENLAAQYNLGTALVKQKRFAEAAEFLRAVVRRQPTNASARKNYGMALLFQGKRCESLPHLQRASELNPEILKNPRMVEQIDRLRSLCS